MNSLLSSLRCSAAVHVCPLKHFDHHMHILCIRIHAPKKQEEEHVFQLCHNTACVAATAGYIAKIIVPEGSVATVGSAVALIASSKEDIDKVAAQGGGSAAAAAPAAAAPAAGMCAPQIFPVHIPKHLPTYPQESGQ